jgi:hypothetical protein
MCLPSNQQQEKILIVDDDLQLQQLLTGTWPSKAMPLLR